MSSAQEMTEQLCVLPTAVTAVTPLVPQAGWVCLVNVGDGSQGTGETHPKGKGSLLGSNKAMAVMEGFIMSSVLRLCIQPGYPLTRLRLISVRAIQ